MKGGSWNALPSHYLFKFKPLFKSQLFPEGSSKPLGTCVWIPAALQLVSTAWCVLSSHSVLLFFAEMQIVVLNVCLWGQKTCTVLVYNFVLQAIQFMNEWTKESTSEWTTTELGKVQLLWLLVSSSGLTHGDYIDSSYKWGFCYKCGLLASGHWDWHLWKWSGCS